MHMMVGVNARDECWGTQALVRRVMKNDRVL